MYLQWYFRGTFVISLVLCRVYALGAGDSLMLTSLIEKGGDSIEEAVKLSSVPSGKHGVKSYSGFFTVNEKCGNNLFFWFFPAESNWETSPVVIWLSGGPDTSAMSGVFDEIGPFQIVNGKIAKKEHPLTATYNVIFLEHQVGMGFSFSKMYCFHKTVHEAMEETYSALTQFFTMFSALQKSPTLITGTLFVSHFGTALATVISNKNKKNPATMKIDVHAILIINARTSTECHDISGYLCQLGFVDNKGCGRYKELYSGVLKKVKEKKLLEAAAMERSILKQLLQETYLPSYHNFAADEDPKSDFQRVVESNHVRKELHVGNAKFYDNNEDAFNSLLAEYFGSPKQDVENLLRSGKVIVGFYNGQLELVSSYSATVCFLNNLEWPGKDDFKTVKRQKWYLKDEFVGWFKASGTLFHVLARKVGQYPAMGHGQIGMELFDAIFASTPTNLLDTLDSSLADDDE